MWTPRLGSCGFAVLWFWSMAGSWSRSPSQTLGFGPASHPLARSRVNYPARKAAGWPDLRFHDLRHTGAVLAAQTGATLAELMGLPVLLGNLDLRQLKLAARALDGSVT